jgi:hypothetical protein
LFAKIELTPIGAEYMNKGYYKYFSPEIIFEGTNPETGGKISNLLIG